MLEQSPMPILDLPSLRDKVTPAEWQARINLAACYRLVALYGMSDMIANHISARVPGEEGAFLINPYGLLYEEITASSLIKIDVKGNVLFKPDFGDLNYGVNRAGFVIHGAIHEASHEIDCVIHTHTWPGMAVSSLECGLLPMNQTAMRFLRIGYHDYAGVVLDTAMQAKLVADLGENNALILRNHGLLTVGKTIADAFLSMYTFENTCRIQIDALAGGAELTPVHPAILAGMADVMRIATAGQGAQLAWPALLRKVERLDPGYKT